MTLFEDICFDLLLEAKTPEEILAGLKYRFKDVPEEVILKLFEIDTTKKKSYTQWVLTHWADESEEIKELLTSGKMKLIFDFIKETHDIQIQGYKSVKELVEDIKYKMSSGLDLLEKNGTGPENDFTILYNGPEWVVVTPNTYAASHKLGVGTWWCTAGWKYDNGEYYYSRYIGDYGGKYYINFDKRSGEEDTAKVERPYKRYQFHFESNQFMDIWDRSVNITTLDMPDDVLKFYEKAEPVLMAKLFHNREYEKKKQAYLQARRNYRIIVDDDHMLLPKFDDSLDIDNLPNIKEYELYCMSFNDEVDGVSRGISLNKNVLFKGQVDKTHKVLILNHNIDDTTDYGENLKTFINGEYPCKPVIFVSMYGNAYSPWYGFDGPDSNYFYSCVENNLFVITDNCVCDMVTNMSNPFGGGGELVKPEKAFINCVIDGGQYLEVVWENGFHSLYCSEPYCNGIGVDRLRCVIQTDFPPEGSEKFEVTNGVAKGKVIHKYDITPGADNFKFSESITDNLCIITNGQKQEAIFNIEKQEICGEWWRTIETLDGVPFFIGTNSMWGRSKEPYYLCSMLTGEAIHRFKGSYDYEDVENGGNQMVVYDAEKELSVILYKNGEYKIEKCNRHDEEEMNSEVVAENFNKFLKRINDVEF